MTWLKLLQNIIRKLSNFPWDSGLRHRRDKKKKSTEESHSIAFNVVQIEIKETNVQHLSYFFLSNGLWKEVQIKRRKRKKGQKRLFSADTGLAFFAKKSHPFYICFWWHLINGQRYKGCSDDDGLHHYIQSTRLLKKAELRNSIESFLILCSKKRLFTWEFLTGLVY